MYKSSYIQEIRDALSQRYETIAVAESVTAGHLQAALSSAKEASSFFQGGMCLYNLGQKCRHLDIDPVHAEAVNCVSERVARNMSLNICRSFCSTWGIGVVGYAAPDPRNKAGDLHAFIAIARDGNIVLEDRLTADHKDPIANQIDFTNQILQRLSGLWNS